MPIGMAMMPSSDAVSSQSAVPSGVKKPLSPARMAKNAKTTIAEIAPPASGRRSSRRSTCGCDCGRSTAEEAAAAVAAFPISPSFNVVSPIWPRRGAVHRPVRDRRSCPLLRADDVRVRVEHGQDLVDVLLVDDARTGRHGADRRQTILHVVIGEQDAV